MFLFPNIGEAQISNETYDVESSKFERQDKFQKHLDLLMDNKYFKFPEKKIFYYDVLDTKEKAKEFAVNLAVMKFPKSMDFIKKYVSVSEDRTGKIWFITTRLGEIGKVTDGELSIIVSKNDCQLIQFSNFF